MILAYEKPGYTKLLRISEHQMILEALARRDAAKAAKLMLEHLENVEERSISTRDLRPPVDLKQVFGR